MTSGTPLTHALLYLKNPKIRIKYPNFGGFALESASPTTRIVHPNDKNRSAQAKYSTFILPKKILASGIHYSNL